MESVKPHKKKKENEARFSVAKLLFLSSSSLIVSFLKKKSAETVYQKKQRVGKSSLINAGKSLTS